MPQQSLDVPPAGLTLLNHGGTRAGDTTQAPQPPTLSTLCLRSLESSLGRGFGTFSLQGLPLGLVEVIYDFVFTEGSRMAQMEISRALAPLLRNHVTDLDCSNEGSGSLGDSALLELTLGCAEGLRRLDLSGCHLVTNEVVAGVLGRCPSLVSLCLSGCDRLTDEVSGRRMPLRQHCFQQCEPCPLTSSYSCIPSCF